jgi:hypothetical protein
VGKGVGVDKNAKVGEGVRGVSVGIGDAISLGRGVALKIGTQADSSASHVSITSPNSQKGSFKVRILSIL